MDKKEPLISIITVVFNGEKTIEETIQSILNQTYENVEYIIIDGGSTDGTVDIIREYSDKISYWVSEPDNGIYDAMNKGIIASKGEIIGIVNADDVLYLDTLANVEALFLLDKVDYVYGKVDFMDEQGVVFGQMLPMTVENIKIEKYNDIPFPHPTLFVKREVYEKIGLFNTKFKLSADYDFILRVLEAKFKGSELSRATGKFRSGGSSGGIETFIDTKNVLLSHNVSSVLTYKNMFSSILKVYFSKYFPNVSQKIRTIFRKNSRHKRMEDKE